MAKKNSNSSTPSSESLALPRRVRQIIDESLAIEFEDARKAGALGFLHRSMAQVTLPHTDPCVWLTDPATGKKLRADPRTIYYERTNGQVTLSVTGNPQCGVPFGCVPRILMAWICSEARLKNSPQIMLGRCQSDFLAKLHMPNDGRYIASVKKQYKALFRSTISLDFALPNGGSGWEDFKMTNAGILFWNDKTPDQPHLWESFLVMDDSFFKSLTDSAVPIDLRILHSLRQSPLAMDIYTWLVYRVFLLRVSGKPNAQIPWGALQLQLGSKSLPLMLPGEDEKLYFKRLDQARRDFRKQFLRRLKEVVHFYPDAQDAFDLTPEHFILRPCRLRLAHTGDAKLNPLG